MKPIKLCFISLNSYPLFIKNSLKYFGGAELQISLIAKKLAQDKRFNISVVVADYDQKESMTKNGLTIHKGFSKKFNYGINLIKFLHTLFKVEADIYIERTLNIKVGLVAMFCKLFHKKFVYMAAHDWDFSPNCGNYLTGLAKYSFLFGIRNADLIICQTKYQQKILKENFNKIGIIMGSIIAQKSFKQIKKNIILWVGRADKWKRPEIFIKLAPVLPKEKLVMICRQGNDGKYYQKIKKLTKDNKNLKFIEAVSADEILSFFYQAKIFINTSTQEGFPNTFLQSGIGKTPIISLQVNPDNFINKYNCGVCTNGNFPKLIKACQNIKRELGNNNYQYVRKFHSLKNVEQLSNVLFNHFGRPAA